MAIAPSRSGPVVSPLTWRRSLVLLAAVLGVLLLVGVAAVVLVRVAGLPPLALLAWIAPLHAVVVLAVIGLLLRRWRVTFVELGFHRPTARLCHLFWQIPLMLVVLVMVAAVSAALLGPSPDQPNAVDALLQGGVRGLVPVAAIGIVVLVPIWEETVFRGVILGGLLRRAPVGIAIPVSSLLFAAAHAVPLLLPYLFAGGVCLALLTRFHRTLWASVIAHASLNALVLLASLQALAGR